MAALLVVAAASGCSQEAKVLDRPATQRAVGRAVAAKVVPAVAATTCPGPLTRGAGKRFDCTVQLGGGAGSLPVQVVQRDDTGSLRVTLSAAVLSGTDIAKQAKAALVDQFGRQFQVDCGAPGYRVRPPGTRVACVARDRTTRRKVTVTVTDVAGTLKVDVSKSA